MLETETRQVLHVGCGERGSRIDRFFDGWRQIRLDIEPSVEPDIVADMTDMRVVQSDSMDAVWSSHSLEHLPAHEVDQALSEFYRVLKPGGIAAIMCPDLQRIAAVVAEDRLEETLYVSSSGPVTALDAIYGFRSSIAGGNHFMTHRTGFTRRSLGAALERAGFRGFVKHAGDFDLFAEGTKPLVHGER